MTALPLDEAWRLTQTEDWTENGGKFRFQASRRQIVHANGKSGGDMQLDVKAKVPMFYDRRVTVPAEETAFPIFFKLEDLQAVWTKGLEGRTDEERKIVGALDVKVTTLDDVVRSITDGEERTEKLVLLTSEVL